MSMFIASANTNTMNTLSVSGGHNPVKIITAKDIAEKLGMKVSAVHRCFMKKPMGKAAVVEKVLKTAEEMGYDTRKARGCRTKIAAPKPEKFWCNGNFHSHKEEVARMLALREEGFSNAEIAKKIGRDRRCVTKNIGAQPTDMTKANRIHGQEHRAAENARRKAYVESHKVAVHNETVRKVNELTEKMNASMAEIRELRKVHDEMVAAITTTESDIRKIAEKMGLEVMEIQPVVYSVPETNTAVQTSFLN